DVPLAAVASAFIPLLLVTVLGHHPAARRRSQAAMESSSRYASHLVEGVTGIETVKAYGLERRRAEDGESRLVELVQAVFALQKLGMSMNGVALFVTTLAGIVILWYGGHRVMDGKLTMGELMFFYSLLGYLLGPLERLTSLNLKLQDALVATD